MPNVPSARPAATSFARAAVRGQLEVMDGGAAVHRDGRDGPPLHQGDQQRTEAHLDDVAAEHCDDRASSRRRHDLIDDEPQILRGENRRQRVEECGERPIQREAVRGRGVSDRLCWGVGATGTVLRREKSASRYSVMAG